MSKFIHSILLCCMFLSGCCTMRNGPCQPVTILSDPPGADIVVDGYYRGVTPQEINMDRKRSHEVLLHKEGYQSEKYKITSNMCMRQLSSNLIYPIAGALTVPPAAMVYFQTTWALAVPELYAIGLLAGTACGIVGVGVDICTGRANVLSTTQIQGHLKPVPPMMSNLTK